MKTKLLAGAAALALLGAFPTLCQAREGAGHKDEPQKVEDVVVVGQSIETTLPSLLSRHGYDVETVSREQIRDGGFVDVSRAVELLVPGAFLTTQAGPFSYVNLSLQGSRTSDVLWTIDGVRINNRLYNSTSPSDTLPAAMVERIEVLKGGHGVLYGTQAAAGVINVVTRAFTDDPAGTLTAGFDTNQGLHLNAALSDSFGRHRFVAWVSQDRSEGYEIFDVYQPGIELKKRGYDVISGGLKYGYDFTDALGLTLQLIRTSAALDYPNANGVSVNDRDETIAIGRLDYTPETGPQFFAKTYYHQWDTDYFTRPNPSAYWGYKDFGASALVRFPTRLADVDLGYDFQNYRGRDEVLLIAGETEQVHALYGQVRTTDDFSDRARLSAGLRYNSTSGSQTVVWSASGVYDLTDALYVEVSGGTSFVLPDAEKLYGVDPCCAAGNADLEPEESLNLNMALGGRFGSGPDASSWQVTGYWREVENLIAEDTSSPPAGFDSVYVNIDGKTDVSGAEAVLRARLSDAFSVVAAWSYSRERSRTTGLQIAGRPEHSGKVSLNFDPEALPLGASATIKFVGETQTTVNGFGQRSFGDYAVVDLSAHWFLDQSRRTRLGVRVDNALDEDYATTVTSAVRRGSSPSVRYMYRRLGMPRTAYVSVGYSF